MLSHTVDGTAIRKARELRGLSPAELAAIVGITRDSLYKVEGNRRQLGPKTVKKVAEALEVEIEKLLAAEQVA